MSAGPTGFPGDPREQPQWGNTSAGPLENPTIQCVPPPYPTAEDVPLGTWQKNSGWMDGSPSSAPDEQEKTFLTGHWGKENGPIFPGTQGKWLPAPVGGWYGPWWQDTSVSGLLTPQESCVLPGICSLTSSSSLPSSNKSRCCCSSICFVSV